MSNENKKLNGSNIGYRGKPVDSLSREELLEAFLELSQRVYECAAEGNQCKDVFKVRK